MLSARCEVYLAIESVPDEHADNLESNGSQSATADQHQRRWVFDFFREWYEAREAIFLRSGLCME